MTRECISHILELRVILLLFQTGFNLVNAAVVCAILESISGLEPSSVITEPETCDCLKLLSIYFDLTGIVCRQLGLLGTDLHATGCGDFVETLYLFFASSSSPAKPSMSSAKQRLVTVCLKC